ncbi:hypothetical protein BDD12DRAFT_807688 [Trichophaea hybrida]|nr:hypothetical protein BDD12DRAFT_807688 [Trichophaea hybrida]
MRVITGKNLIILRDLQEEKDQLAAEKVVKKAAKKAAKKAKFSDSLQSNTSATTSKKKVTIVVPSDDEQSGSTDLFESEVDSNHSMSESPILTTGYTQHHPVPTVLNTFSNPNPCLPDRPLGMSL